MSKIVFYELAWEQYLYWQTQDKKFIKKLNKLLADIDRNGNAGILFLSVCVVDKSAGNAVGHLVRVCGIDFFKHDFILSLPEAGVP